ncbi:MAG: hypothetical protein EAZ57_05810 [Cytophagales bacterium]|nr:MAG: hypothetical protein EAZ67_06715 [Cytophagales bacterium]TAF60867.1 MAG: hypothetical protein EAZ57_05810 [Cytophagales bacterium]
MEATITHKQQQFEALLLINANTDIWQVLDLVSNAKEAKFLIISTHFLFEHETDFLQNACPANLEFSFMACWFSDEEATQIDQQAVQSTAKRVKNNTAHPNYMYILSEEMLFFKHKTLWKKLQKEQYEFKTIYYQADATTIYNLGISIEFWKQIPQAKTLKNFKLDYENRTTAPQKLWSGLQTKIAVLGTLTVTVVEDTDFFYVFLMLPRRLKWTADIKISTLKVSVWKHLVWSLKNNKLAKVYKRIFDKIAQDLTQGSRKEARAAVNMHDFGASRYSELRNDIYIFNDAFRSTNYFEYVARGLPFGTIVVRDMYDDSYWRKYHIPCLKPTSFLQKNFMQVRQGNFEGIRTVVLLLQHAGDWSATINRSDTDILLLSFVKLAATCPQQTFIIRLHPTMQHPLHEGQDAVGRVEELVRQSGLPNLAVSLLSLEQDLARGDFFISEYSLTLIDALQRNKVGLMVNLTNRRSFMVDYEALGFVYAHGIGAFFEMSHEIMKRPDIFLALQRMAAEKYNAQYAKFLESGN